MVRLVTEGDALENMLDFFVRDSLLDISGDEKLDEFFISYFKKNILGNAINTDNLYLSEDEKRLEYAGRNTVEPLAEYLMIIADADERHKKRDYAEKGAVFSIVHPVIAKEGNERYFVTSASMFYGMVSDLSHNEDSRDFYSFLSGHTKEMRDGLEQVIGGVVNDGQVTLNNFYGEAVSRYETSSDPGEREELAQIIAATSHRIGMSTEDVPLDREHYHFLFEVPEQKAFGHGQDEAYNRAFDELMRKSTEETTRRYSEGRRISEELGYDFGEDSE